MIKNILAIASMMAFSQVNVSTSCFYNKDLDKNIRSNRHKSKIKKAKAKRNIKR